MEAFDEVGNTQDQQHYQVIEKLDQLFYLVKANEEHVKKLQVQTIMSTMWCGQAGV